MSDPALHAAAVQRRLTALAAALRARGVPVGIDRLARAHRVLTVVDPASMAQARDALRATLCSSREQLGAFEDAFSQTFDIDPQPGRRAVPPTPAASEALEEPRKLTAGALRASDETTEPSETPRREVAWSDLEALRDADFATLDADQLQTVRELLPTLIGSLPLRPSRRLAPSPRRRRSSHDRLDQRATLRAALSTGGEPAKLCWRSRKAQPRQLVLLLDVSGSMRLYAEPLMLYVHALVAWRRRVEAFAFSTTLTRMTLDLADPDPGAAMARVQSRVSDWSGGTRIGPALAALNREHGRRLGRGAVAVILSDGWDRGAPEQLADEIKRVRRSVYRLVWLNPLKARAGYEPLTRGMQAALPHVDAFLAGNSLASLGELAVLLERGLG